MSSPTKKTPDDKFRFSSSMVDDDILPPKPKSSNITATSADIASILSAQKEQASAETKHLKDTLKTSFDTFQDNLTINMNLMLNGINKLCEQIASNQSSVPGEHMSFSTIHAPTNLASNRSTTGHTEADTSVHHLHGSSDHSDANSTASYTSSSSKYKSSDDDSQLAVDKTKISSSSRSRFMPKSSDDDSLPSIPRAKQSSKTSSSRSSDLC